MDTNMFQSPVINPSPQGRGGLGALNQTQQPAPSLLNQQIPSVQQAPMQQPVNALLPAMPTPPMNTIPLGQGVTANTSIDDYRNSVLQMQNNPRIANIPNYQDWVNSTIYAANQAAAPRMGSEFNNQPLNPLRPSPSTPFGGFPQPRVPNVNPDQNPNWQWGSTGGPLTSPLTNQPLNPLRPSPSTPFGGFPKPRVPNVNAEPRNPLYPFGNTGGPFPGSPAPTPAGGFYDPRPGMIDEARRNGTIFAGDQNFTPTPRTIYPRAPDGSEFSIDRPFTPAPTPRTIYPRAPDGSERSTDRPFTPAPTPKPFLGGLSNLLSKKFGFRR